MTLEHLPFKKIDLYGNHFLGIEMTYQDAQTYGLLVGIPIRAGGTSSDLTQEEGYLMTKDHSSYFWHAYTNFPTAKNQLMVLK
jgi:hypothetical protein